MIYLIAAFKYIVNKAFCSFRFLTNYVRNDNIVSFRGDSRGIYNFKRLNSQCIMRSFVLISMWLLLLGMSSEKPLTIYLIGDSTMSDKPDPRHNPERGWGQMLPVFFAESVTIKNHARNGRSSKSFIEEGLWKAVLDSLQPGDYVFIQFGHNDQKDYDSTRFTNPYTGYRRNLEKFVRETREKEAIPILFTPIVRRNFNEKGVLVDTHGAYPLVVRMVANDMQVPFIDLQWLSEAMVLAAGPEKSKGYYLWIEAGRYEKFPEGKQDNTHLNEKGATEVARLAIRELIHLNMPLGNYLTEQYHGE